jgi:peptide/nickel transport system substrate-binding protein
MHPSSESLRSLAGASPLSRRRFLALTAATAGATILAACGGAGAAPTATTASQATPALPPTQVPASAATRPASSAAASASSPAAGTASPTIQAIAPGKPGGTKTFRIGILGTLSQLDPALISSQVDYQVAEAIFNYLGRHTYNPPLGNDVLPELADWEVGDDAKTYIFHLKKGVKFYGGYGELTTADVKYCWDRIADPKTASPYRADFLGSTVQIIDPYTIKISFDHNFPAFLSASVAFRPGFMISPKAYMELGDRWITRPIGTGPFLFDNYQSGTSLTLKRNSDYWGPQPKVDQITYRYKVDDRTAVLAIAKGELDAFYIADPDIAANVAKNPDPNSRFLTSVAGQSPFSVAFNINRKPLDDIRVRQALRYAIDNKAIAKDLFGGLATPINSFLPPFMFGYSEDVTRFDFNPDKARQLLKEANVPADWAPHMISSSGLIISRRVTEAVASYWADVGVKVKAESLEPGILAQRESAKDFDMDGTYIARIDPDQIASSTYRSTTNRGGYAGADGLIDQAKAEPDPVKRAKLYRDLQDKISQDSPSAFIVAVSENLLLNKRVAGLAGAGWQERYDWFNVDVPAE